MYTAYTSRQREQGRFCFKEANEFWQIPEMHSETALKTT